MKLQQAHLWARPRPRVTRLPEHYQSESALAKRRRERREREAAKNP